MTDKTTCAAKGCENEVVRRPGQRGRPPVYCSPECRPSYSRPPIAVQVLQIDDAGYEHGRDWTVRLRRGDRVLVVRDCLGRFSATVFAAELSSLIAGASKPLGGDLS
jgi:hypothetical protein